MACFLWPSLSGNLDKELAEVEGKVQRILEKLPRNINPVNLEKLRSVKAALVDIEGKVCPFITVSQEQQGKGKV